MTKLFHLKSDHDREKIGDIVVNLNKVLRIRAFIEKNKFCLLLCQEDIDQKAWFKDKDKFVDTFKDLITKMGGDSSIVDDYVLFKQQENKMEKKIRDLLSNLQDKIDN